MFSFIDNGGLDVLNSWLDSADCPAVVIRHALEALATLPLTQAHLIAHPQLLERLDALRSHSDESISQLADDTYSSYSHKLSSSALTGDLEDEAEAEVEAAGALENSSTSKFHLIKIDKSSADMHEHQLAIHANTEDERDLKPLVFANAVSEVGDVSVDDVLVNEENKQKQLNDKIEAIKIDSDTKNESNNNTETNNDNINIDSNNATNDSMIDSSASSSPSSSAKKKKPRRSVTWVEDSAIEKIKLFFKDEPIIKLPAIKTQAELNKERTKTLANSIPLKPSIEWSTPEKLNLPAASQAIYQSRGKDSKEKEIQAEREKKSLKTFYQPHELPPNPAEAEISTELPPPEIPIIPFHPITQTTPQQPPAQGKGDLLSQLSSLASMIGAKSPNGSSTTSTNSSVSGSLASLSSLINNLKPPTQTPQPVPYTPAPVAPYSTPAPAPAAGTSKLLSLLAGGGGSALGNIAAALSGNKPIQPTSQPNTQAPASRWDRPPQTAPNTAAPPPQQHYPPPQQHYAPPQPQQPASYAQPPPVYQQPPPAAHAPYNYQTPPVHQPPPQQYAPPPAPYSQSSYYGGQSVPAYQPPAHLQYQPPPPQPAQQPQYGGYQPQQPPHQPPAQPHSGFTSYHVPPQQHQHPPVNQQVIILFTQIFQIVNLFVFFSFSSSRIFSFAPVVGI